MAILKRLDDTVIAEDPNKTIKQLVVENHANLYANLNHANLNYANLNYANLNYANLNHANLNHANLDHANLNYANLDHANLDHANLNYANLNHANLNHAKIEFFLFPSIRLISSINLGILSSALSTELMRWDALMHPASARFEAWANGESCPYKNEERLFYFETRKKDWKKGEPKMGWVELCKTICKEKGWKIRGVEI